MARAKKSAEREWSGTTRGVRTPPPTWANDAMGEPLSPAGRNGSGLSAREMLLANAMQRALERQDEDELRWVLKQVTNHEVDRIRFGPRGVMLEDVEMSSPARADDALRLLGLTAPDEYGQPRLRRFVVDMALEKRPGNTRSHMGLGRYIEGPWDGPMPKERTWDEFNEYIRR